MINYIFNKNQEKEYEKFLFELQQPCILTEYFKSKQEIIKHLLFLNI
jgi:hypothetical protein